MNAKALSPDGLLVLDKVDSTNEEARRCVDRGRSGPLWIIATEQLSGRGRHGRVWNSPPGNLYASYLMTFDGGPGHAARLSFLAALSIYDLILPFADKCSVALKWPNDVLLNNKKVSGILLESFGKTPEGRQSIAIGFGVNLSSVPEIPEHGWPATSVLSETGTRVSSEDALDRLAESFAHWLSVLEASGFAAIRAAWLERAAHLGKQIQVRLPNQIIDGVFLDLDLDGVLVLDSPDGLRRIAAGDVFFPGEAHAAGH